MCDDDEFERFLGEIAEVEAAAKSKIKTVSAPPAAPVAAAPSPPAVAPPPAVATSNINERLKRLAGTLGRSESTAQANAPPIQLPKSLDGPPAVQAALGGAAAPSHRDSQTVYGGGKVLRSMRQAGDGSSWLDPTMEEWPAGDHRVFLGNLGNDVNSDVLSKAFHSYSSFQKAKVIRDKRTLKSKGYGFVSFAVADDAVRAIKEMNGKYIGNRPVIVRMSTWEERQVEEPKAWNSKQHAEKKKRNRKYHYGGVVEPPKFDPY